MLKTILITLLSVIIYTHVHAQAPAAAPLKLAIAGLSHGHVDWAFNREGKKDIQLVGIYEPNQELAERYAKRYQLPSTLFFTDLNKMLAQVKPEAVSAFGAISEHITIIRACAPRRIHVMVEKPLAVSLKEAQEINTLSKKYGIHVLTNFETSWYASNQYLNQLIKDGKIGKIRKVMVNDGHEGPAEIGVSKEFLEILTDPRKNGAGALYDFGCYGANLMTWLMKGERPLSVTAVTQQNKPHIYKDVDDEASIILQYPTAQCIIQASWNWTFARKDMAVYGDKGYAIAVDATHVTERLNGKSPEKSIELEPRPAPHTDPFSVLAMVMRGQLKLDENDLYGLPLNVTVVEILEAAKESATSNKTVFLN
ncbi:Gfo/Idh/MocA family protein [Pedobacter immunditicola]|uniref:Gfo/Idh/MocA family protein n=1 Tax=Pedobacter immunditicola TaxID=3133440 RepID=UPI0030A61AE2